ncbi:MAG: site-specific DNA-methyltransferase [Thermoguttaceae bacterium]|nr:site-specific DNA-methyltransferase [Thermoguttaceae bacterium]
MPSSPKRAPRNQTLTLTEEQYSLLQKRLDVPLHPLTAQDMENRVFNCDLFDVLDSLPERFVDLMIIDPPYNLTKEFNGLKFNRRNNEAYIEYLEQWFPRLIKTLKPTASVYLCGDWKCSAAEFTVLDKYLTVQNRIVWQREKGRGAKRNWKNCSEDVWFATVSDSYYFDVDAVKMKRRVLAPYRVDGKPKDWQETDDGAFRMTHPSNFWDDISIPYWSMPENTDHPTQKPEKLLAKLILASSQPGDLVFDPFLGSGTTAVVAKKLGRKYCGIELNEQYCCWALARLDRAEQDAKIQGYSDGVFWERNSGK